MAVVEQLATNLSQSIDPFIYPCQSRSISTVLHHMWIHDSCWRWRGWRWWRWL